GIIPIAKIEKFCNAPPPKVLRNPKTFCVVSSGPVSKICFKTSLFVNGTGICVPIRKITNINNVKTIFCLISFTFIKLDIVRNIKSPQCFRKLFLLLQQPMQRTDSLQQLIFYQEYLYQVL